MLVLLGLSIKRDAKDGTIMLAQQGLTERILRAMYLEEANPDFTPAEEVPLTTYFCGERCCEEWEYWSMIGVILYLAGIKRPYISYAVHQYTSFSHKTRKSHETAVKNWKIPKGYQDKEPDYITKQKYALSCLFADTTFTGLFASENKVDPISVKSRTDIHH